MFKIGDQVAVIDEKIEGIISDVSGDRIVIETRDGLSFSYSSKEIVKIANEISVTNQQVFNAKKIKNDSHQKKKSTIERLKSKTILEVDLHIEKLTSHSKGMDTYDILELQINTAKNQIKFAESKQINKVIFIHGHGTGVLKKELEFLLSQYPSVTYTDASYQKYGFGGALEVQFN